MKNQKKKDLGKDFAFQIDVIHLEEKKCDFCCMGKDKPHVYLFAAAVTILTNTLSLSNKKAFFFIIIVVVLVNN